MDGHGTAHPHPRRILAGLITARDDCSRVIVIAAHGKASGSR